MILYKKVYRMIVAPRSFLIKKKNVYRMIHSKCMTSLSYMLKLQLCPTNIQSSYRPKSQEYFLHDSCVILFLFFF